MLPDDQPDEPFGDCEIGTPEMTRFRHLQKQISRPLGGIDCRRAHQGEQVKDKVNQLRGRFLEMEYV